MPIRTFVIVLFLFIDIAFGYSRCYVSANNSYRPSVSGIIDINDIVFFHAEFFQEESQPDSTDNGKTADSKKNAESEKKEEGFLKKLFTGATKAEKAEKLEAKKLKNLEKKQTKIYGWHPYWMKNTQADYNYNLLTTLSYYSLDASFNKEKNRIDYSDNNIKEIQSEDLFARASGAGCRIDVTFKSQDSTVIDSILNYPKVQDSCINYLLNILDLNYKYDGVCIAFENIPSSNSASLLAFMSALKEALKGSNRTLKIALPAKDFKKNYDILNLNKIVDEYILMAYNYHHKGSAVGAVSPFYDNNRKLHLKASVTEYLDKGVPYKKLIVALPFYGIVWKEDKQKKDKYTFSKHLTYSQIKHQLKTTNSKIKFDSVSYTYYYDYVKNDNNFRCYFDNEKSLARKYKWLVNQNIAGIGIWALGYDKGNPEFWKMINKNFIVEKLPPLKKKIIVRKETSQDTLYIYHLIDSIIRHTNVKKDTVLMDSILKQFLSTYTSKSDTADRKNIILVKLKKLATVFKPLISNRKIAATVVVTFIVFGLIGILASLLFSSVRELLYITNLPTYLFINFSLILFGLALFGFLELIKTDISVDFFCDLKKGVWITLVLLWFLINVLSYRLLGFVSLKYDKP